SRIVVSLVAKERLVPDGRVVVASRVIRERQITVGRVGDAGGIFKERRITIGRIFTASGIGKKRKGAVGRVVAGSGVAVECPRTDRHVVGAIQEAEEPRISLSRVAVGIGSIRPWANCKSRQRKSKEGDGDRKHTERKTAP